MADSKKQSEGKDQNASGEKSSISEHDRELAQQAAEEFDKGNFDGCLKVLNKLIESRGADPRISHNVALVEYYKSGFTKTDEFKQALTDVCSKAHVHVENIGGLEDVDQCVLYYNHAVLLYHTRQYRASLAIMDKLFQFIEPMEESLARKVMFLLVELYLCTHQPEKAMGMLNFVEKSLFGNGKSNHSSGEGREGTPQESSNNEVWRPRVAQYKARSYMMLKSMKSCKREVKGLMNTQGMTTPVVYLKANFEYLRGNYRKAIKVMNTAPQSPNTTAQTGESLSTMYYNNMGVIHFYMRKHNLGTFYFRKAMQENEQTTTEFNKQNPNKSLSGRPLQTLSISRHYEMLYNMGIQFLHCGQPLPAFERLLETTRMFTVNPRLWLRLAECCIMAHKASNDEDRQLGKKAEVVQGSIGAGVHRKLLFGPGLQPEKTSTESAAIPLPTLEFASLCLRNALMLLPSDPLDAPPQTTDEQGEARPNFEAVLVPAPPGNPLRATEVANLRCSILACSSYVALCLNDYTVALQQAERLLRQPRLSAAHKYVGHLYIAEALVSLDRIADAVSHLNPDNVTDITTQPPEQKHEQEKVDKNGDKDAQEQNEIKGALYPWSPRDVPRARAIMLYNLSCAHALRGEHEKAIMYLETSVQNIGTPLPAQMYFLMIYLQLMEGKRQVVQSIVKEHFGHVTPNRVS